MSEYENDFLPDDYELPQGSFAKIVTGENRFRILSPAVTGWLDWTDDKKCVRFKMDAKPAKAINPKNQVKHFWAMKVYNYSSKSVQILELTSKTIMSAIKNCVADKDWGSPLNYDIKIVKSGSGMETEYEFLPCPAKPKSIEVETADKNNPCFLPAIFTGDDPFSTSSSM